MEGLNQELQDIMWGKINPLIPQSNASFVNVEKMKPFLHATLEIINEFRGKSKYYFIFNEENNKRKIETLMRKISYVLKDIKDNRAWIVNLDYNSFLRCKIPEFKPIKIDQFLKEHVWHYGKKILLTSATIPYRANIKKWLKRLGLGDKSFTFMQAPMSFPIDNRPIYLNKMAGSLSYKNKEKNWEGCIKNVKEILEMYSNKKGVIHVSSYSMMWDLFNELREFSIFLHDKRKLNDMDVIEGWEKSNKQVLISPSIFEGVDLNDDKCRFQILFKIPFANLKDGRVNHLLFKEKDQEWYNNETMMKIAQAYGRAVRSDIDHADFYIIDGDFLPFYQRVVFPKWFNEAMER